MPSARDRIRQRRWEAATAAALLVGYAGYYVCRSNLSVVAPQLLAEFQPRGFDKTTLGFVSSAGVLAYAAGKTVNGIAGDFVGGRRMFLSGMVGSVAATLVFGMSGTVAAFAIIWAINRFIQSAGWSALVKIAAHWFAPARYGRLMGLLSLSFLFGDAAGRLVLGALVTYGAGWRMVFLASAAMLAAIAAGCAIVLRESPRDVGLPEPPVSPRNVYAEAGATSRPAGVADLVIPYVRNPAFWLVCIVALGLTLVRESFNAWTPTYLVDVYGLEPGDAAQKSSLFPFVGGVSVLCVGLVSDRTRMHRLALAVPFLAGGVLALAAIGSRPAVHNQGLGLALLSAVAFCLIGPYSLLAGAIAVELGGRRGSATAAGLIDTAGYVGAVLSGAAIGMLVQHDGWTTVFRLLAFVTALSAVACILCCVERRVAESAAAASEGSRAHAR